MEEVEKLAGEALKRWLVDTVKLEPVDAQLVVAEKITAALLLNASREELKELLELAKLPVGPRYSILKKVGALQGE